MDQQTQPNQTQAKSTEIKPAQNQPVKSDGSKTAIIIVIVVILLVLGVGGYFAWKYFGQKIINKITGKTTETATTSNNKVKIQSVFDALVYPESKITDQKLGEQSTIYVAEMTLSSSADVTTIKNYYVKLINDNKWKITRQGSSSDQNYYLTFESSDFTAELDITRYPGYDTTDIRIGLNGDKLSSDGISISTVAPPTTGTITETTSTTTTGTTSTTGTTTQSGSDYVISDSSTREISRSELISLTPWKLKVARNEIYARHGRPFVHKDLQCYFAKKSWYKVDNNYNVSSVTYIENKNIATIQAYEQATNSPLQSSDSGCNTNN